MNLINEYRWSNDHVDRQKVINTIMHVDYTNWLTWSFRYWMIKWMISNWKDVIERLIIDWFTGGAPPPAGSVPKFSGEMPNEDVMDDPNSQEAQPTAPPMEKMDNIGGYSNVGFNASK